MKINWIDLTAFFSGTISIMCRTLYRLSLSSESTRAGMTAQTNISYVTSFLMKCVVDSHRSALAQAVCKDINRLNEFLILRLDNMVFPFVKQWNEQIKIMHGSHRSFQSFLFYSVENMGIRESVWMCVCGRWTMAWRIPSFILMISLRERSGSGIWSVTKSCRISKMAHQISAGVRNDYEEVCKWDMCLAPALALRVHVCMYVQ